MNQGPERIAWTVHPLRRSLAVASGLACFTAGLPVLLYMDTQDPVLALTALGVLLLSLRTFYLPTRYVLDPEGVTVACFPFRVHRPWSAFRGWQEAEGALRLTPFEKPSRLDPFRGVLLRFDGDGGAIRAYLDHRFGRGEA